MTAKQSKTGGRTGAGRKPRAELAEAVVEGIQNPDLVQIRRDQICDASLELFLEKGFASTTIRDICARSGVNQASIYDYVANKHDILRRLLNKLWFRTDAPTLPEMLDARPDEPLEEVLVDYLRQLWGTNGKGIMLSYRAVPHLRDADRRAMIARERRMMADLAVHLRRLAGVPEDDPHAEIMANLMVFMTAFGPMRDRLNRGVDPEVVLRTVAFSMAAMVERLARESAARGDAPASGPSQAAAGAGAPVAGAEAARRS
ncbi:TetR/AcrR family transcriptional regulator [Albimonas sp. CAU 1670]|uniref:TetR/AcrR family transcriptional regulator n=1 Tax=Albimonas sp. CAU 1670 TaxID=3032599 RepID=UPI0023DCDF4A|nr:TetR/AcrR family transcriptional regulator [Albimonas sp. CAU 1670]MDF2233635.1 TetR/AcrR family transcriptional regulator [Albimonas sp. CAU 1670]